MIIFFLLHRSRIFTPVLYNFSLRCMLIAFIFLLEFQCFFFYSKIYIFEISRYYLMNQIPKLLEQLSIQIKICDRKKQTNNYDLEKKTDNSKIEVFWIAIFIFCSSNFIDLMKFF